MNKNLRQELRRQPRRLAKLGELEYNEYEDHEDRVSIESFLNEWLEAKNRRWPGWRKHKWYIQKMVDSALPLKLIHLSSISINGKNVSWHIGFRKNGTYFYYSPCFSNEYATYSPGKVHLGYLVECAVSSKYTKFDFMRGMSDYKLFWTDKALKLYGISKDMPGVQCKVRRSLGEAYRRLKRHFEG